MANRACTGACAVKRDSLHEKSGILDKMPLAHPAFIDFRRHFSAFSTISRLKKTQFSLPGAAP